MKKTLFLLVLFLSCTDDEGNPCVYQPTLTTEAVTNITETSATLNGTIDVTSENCETPNNIEQGFVYSTEIQPTIEDIQVNVNGTNISTTLEGLTPNTTYYVRTFLTNALGEFYGNEMEFTTVEESSGCIGTGTVTDQDGNIYNYICYNDQAWTVENSEIITYRDGTPIPQVTDDEEWGNLSTGAWCYYDNNPTKPRLYNWYAVMGIYDTASYADPNLRKEFAPEGWHVPSDVEWTILEEYLIANGYNYDGTSYNCSPCSYNGVPGMENKIAKAMASTTGWDDFGHTLSNGVPAKDQSLNNSSGFNALPVGYRSITTNNTGYFNVESYGTIFWSSTEPGINAGGAFKRYLSFNSRYLARYSSLDNRTGVSVRLVRD